VLPSGGVRHSSESLGKDHILTTLSVEQGPARPYRLRIQATDDGTALTFDPAIHSGVTINRGEVLEIEQVDVNLRVSSTIPVAVTQICIRLGRLGRGAWRDDYFGGPIKWVAVPVSQFRSSYVLRRHRSMRAASSRSSLPRDPS